MRREINAYVLRSIALIVAIGFGFCAILIVWLRRNVTEPVEALERSARSFAEKSHERKDPDLLLFDAPEIHTGNELESLSDAITKMSKDMRDYVKDIITAEQRAESAEAEVEGMSRIAYEDPLTHVKSKAAYVELERELDGAIAGGEAGLAFAMVVCDVNGLKSTNDELGHDAGDKLLYDACQAICQVYAHSPVFRIGGDELLAIAEGVPEDELKEKLSMLDQSLAQYNKDREGHGYADLSLSTGFSAYRPGQDSCFHDVFVRADEDMYRTKVQFHHVRE
jgi:diguanylate cyclase (GGDEF)-like protein